MPESYWNAAHLDELDPKRQIKARRKQILERFGGLCFYCWEKSNALTIDHVQPQSKGGSNYFANLQPACLDCNNRKSDHDALNWYRRQAFHNLNGDARLKEWIL